MAIENQNYKIMVAADWVQSLEPSMDITHHPKFMTYFGGLNRSEYMEAMSEIERRIAVSRAELATDKWLHGNGR